MAKDTAYKKLCSVDVFHHYHLDDGTVAFDSNPTVKQAQLKGYNKNVFARLTPAVHSAQQMKGRKLFFKETSQGFELLAAAKPVPTNTTKYTTARGVEADFYVYVLLHITDPLFENYSTVSAKVEQPYYFSNRRPDGHGGTFNYIDVTATKPIEDFTISEASFSEVASVLQPRELLGLFGVIALRMKGSNTVGVDGDARDLLKTNGRLVDDPPAFKIQFANRSTIWNYRSQTDGSLLHSSDPTTLPLVKRGIVGYSFDSEDRPAARPDRLLFEKDNNGNIIKTFSEIYI